jgi:hypothetical protein
VFSAGGPGHREEDDVEEDDRRLKCEREMESVMRKRNLVSDDGIRRKV